MLPSKTLAGINNFASSCDELISGKYIFAINKIQKILQSISDCDEIYSVFAECLKTFNYGRALAHAKQKLPTKKGEFLVPDKMEIFLPLIFCILVDVQENKIDFKALLNDYFYDGENEEFYNFVQKLIVPFKKSVLYLFDMGETPFKKEENSKPNSNLENIVKPISKEQADNNLEIVNNREIDKFKESSITEDDNQKEIDINLNKEPKYSYSEFYEEVSSLCTMILDNISLGIKGKQAVKEDCKYVVKSLDKMAKNKDLQGVSTTIVSLNYLLDNLKQIRFFGLELKNCLEKLYIQ